MKTIALGLLLALSLYAQERSYSVTVDGKPHTLKVLRVLIPATETTGNYTRLHADLDGKILTVNYAQGCAVPTDPEAIARMVERSTLKGFQMPVEVKCPTLL